MPDKDSFTKSVAKRGLIGTLVFGRSGGEQPSKQESPTPSTTIRKGIDGLKDVRQQLDSISEQKKPRGGN